MHKQPVRLQEGKLFCLLRCVAVSSTDYKKPLSNIKCCTKLILKIKTVSMILFLNIYFGRI